MPRRLALFSLVIATISASSVFSTTASGTDAGEVDLCFGQVPTIVGGPGKFVQGTEGPDVVLTKGAYAADTLGGDDLLCVAMVIGDRPEGATGYEFKAGSGTDRIDASQAGGGYFRLGPGPDSFIGSDDGFDTVYADDLSEEEPDADLITTGDYPDTVYSRGADDVDLGAGEDDLFIKGAVTGGVYVGGPDHDDFTLNPLIEFGEQVPQAAHAWKINNRAKLLSRDDAPMAQFRGFQAFWAAIKGSVTFVGSKARESFGPDFYWVPRKTLVKARMGGGNDVIVFRGGAPGARFDGGAGTDQFWYFRNYERLRGHTAILFNLASGLLRDTWAGGETTRKALHFENTKVFSLGVGYAGPITIKGTSGPNRLKAVQPPTTMAKIFGRDGDDSIYGGRGDDVLIGGAGHDQAYGRHGLDRCGAESKLGCER